LYPYETQILSKSSVRRVQLTNAKQIPEGMWENAIPEVVISGHSIPWQETRGHVICIISYCLFNIFLYIEYGEFNLEIQNDPKILNFLC
jgi:hypothetical protein